MTDSFRYISIHPLYPLCISNINTKGALNTLGTAVHLSDERINKTDVLIVDC